MASIRKREWTYKGDTKSAWCVEYTDVNGARKRQTPASGLKKDADKLRVKIEQELERGDHLQNSYAATVSVVCDDFLRHCEIRLKEGSIGTNRIRIMRQAVDGYLVPKLGGVLLNQLTFVLTDRWYNDMVKKGLSTTTVRAYLLVAKMVGDFAVKRGMAKGNPFAEVMREHRGNARSRIETLDLEQVRLVIKSVETPGYNCSRRQQAMLKSAVHLAAFCGLRYGEIMGLTRDNVNLSSGIIRVRHSLTVEDELKGPKTSAGNRDVPMPDHVQIILSDWFANWAVLDRRGLVFRRPDASMFFSTSFRKTWHRLLERSGLGRPKNEFHFHALRHFAASFMIELGWPVTEVASLLGHSTFDVTLQIYAHPVVGGHRRHGMMQAMANRALILDLHPAQTRQECDMAA
ncbi:tyrosine-type recombinase/integrase [Lichenihabitans psoromatis]|uniref:tyrosine-type recombinase/integrase n=1 Tax=Lichenihabitans psoromatis TaxID=2528642 RepID=UPI0010369F4D|nr:site-specific integrase [Lichenihabitans psoromatis]